MTTANETAPKDCRHSWFGTACFVVGILSRPPFWSGLYAWLDGYMPWRDRPGGIWGWSMPASKHEIALPDMQAGGKMGQRNWA